MREPKVRRRTTGNVATTIKRNTPPTAGTNKTGGALFTRPGRTTQAIAILSRIKRKKGTSSEVKSKTTSTRELRYLRIHQDSEAESDSEESVDYSNEGEELKFVDFVEKSIRPTNAPLRITVKLRRGGLKFEALLDSGAPKSIINSETLAANRQAGRRFIPASPTVFETMSGAVSSIGSTVIQFGFQQLKPETIITHRFEVIEDSSDAMVIGRNLMNSLGLILNFKEGLIHWEDCSLRLNTGQSPTKVIAYEQQDREFLEEFKEASDHAVEPDQLLPNHLEGKRAQQYLALLVKYRSRYDGHLGRMRFPDYELPLSPDYKPVHAKPYAVPRSKQEKAKIGDPTTD